MSSQPAFQGFHHLTLTINNLKRSREFYVDLLGFKVIADLSATRIVIGNDHLFFGITEPTNPARRIPNDCFDENRVGLDHLSFTVNNRDEIEQWRDLFDKRGVHHAEIHDLPAFGIVVMTFWDPDNIQLEISAPLN
jgi:glyoxylase I family protein